MKLELGGGDNPTQGYDGIDHLEKFGSLYCFDMECVLPWPIDSQKYDEVLAIHVMEHFNLGKANIIFKEVFRILKPGGIFKVHVPNGDIICKSYLSKNDKSICIGPIYGGESDSEDTYRFAHKVLYDEIMLSNMFLKTGFLKITNFTEEITDRHDIFWDKHLGGKISLKISGIKD